MPGQPTRPPGTDAQAALPLVAGQPARVNVGAAQTVANRWKYGGARALLAAA